MTEINHTGAPAGPAQQTSGQPPPSPESWQPGLASTPAATWPSGTVHYPVAGQSAWQRMSGLDKALIILGFIGAVLSPLIGAILGFVVLARGHSKAAAGGILGISFVMLILVAATLSGTPTTWLVDF